MLEVDTVFCLSLLMKNMDGGQIARNLTNLYAFILESLIKADSQNDLQALSEDERVICISSMRGRKCRQRWQSEKEVQLK
jgi:flagellin-specific chaperone FliS